MSDSTDYTPKCKYCEADEIDPIPRCTRREKDIYDCCMHAGLEFYLWCDGCKNYDDYAYGVIGK